MKQTGAGAVRAEEGAADFVRRNHGTGGRFHGAFTCVPDLANVRTTTDTLILVTGDECHLCEHGRRVLAALAVHAREVDVDGDEAAALAARGIPLAFLPVLTDGERIVAYGRFSQGRLRRELAL